MFNFFFDDLALQVNKQHVKENKKNYTYDKIVKKCTKFNYLILQFV